MGRNHETRSNLTKSNFGVAMEDFKLIPLNQGKFAIVDPEDYDHLAQFKWHYGGGYVRCFSYDDRVCVAMHRIVVKVTPGICVDHINGNTLDNRKCNLRLCKHNQNVKNIRKSRTGKTSEYKGVYQRKGSKVWIAKLGRKSIGRFETQEEAARYYDAAARFYFGEFAATNFEGSEALSIEDIRSIVRSKVKSNCKSRFVGVSWHKDARKWTAYICVQGKPVHLGSFDNEEEAASIRDQKVTELGLKSKLNFPG